MGDGLRDDRFEALFEQMLTLWDATDFEGCETWFDRSQRVEGLFGTVEHRVDLTAMNYAVHRAIRPDAPFAAPLRDLVDRPAARAIFQASLMRVLMGAAGVWQKDNLEIARRYFI
jgi:hypothetical protein